MRSHHSFLAGLTGGLILSQESLVILAVGVVIGAGAVLLWGTAARVVRWGRRTLGRAPAAPMTTLTRADEPPYDWRRPW